jgi:hypothetical protein
MWGTSELRAQTHEIGDPIGVREVGLGDQLLVEGDLKEQTVLLIKEAIRANMCYTFTAGEYEKTGEADQYEFYNERPMKGKVKINFPCDPTPATPALS